MGCCASKGGDDKGYASLGVPKWDDEIFGKAQAVQDKADEMKEALTGGKMGLFENTGMQWLKNPSLLAAMECWLYSSACDAADLEQFKPEITMEEPYVSMPDSVTLSKPNKESQDAIVAFFKTLVDAPASLQEMMENMKGIVDAANGAKDSAADDFSSLGAMDKMKAMKNLGSNMSKLAAAQKELAELPEVIKKATEEVTAAISALPASLGKAKEMVEKVKGLGKDTSAETVAKECLDGDKNDEAAAKAYSAENFKKADAEAPAADRV